MPRKRARQMLLWKDSQCDTVSAPHLSEYGVQLLDYPVIASSKHQWTIEVKELCANTWVGVVHTGYSINKGRFAGLQAGGWMYSNHGTLYNNHNYLNSSLPTFEVGSKVTLTLDLTVESSGTLKASVNGGAPFELVTGLRSAVEGKNGGFVPAVSLRAPGRVRIMDIQKLQN